MLDRERRGVANGGRSSRDDYQEFLKLRPNMVEARANLGAALAHEGKFDEVIVECRRALSSAPGDKEIQMNMELAYYKKGDLANAANPDFEYVLGTALIQSGDRREGVKRLEKVAESTQNADAYLLAGSTLIDLNDATHAKTNLEEALKLNPKLPHVYTLNGMALDLVGDADAAVPDFREALRRDPDDLNANMYSEASC